MHTTEAFRPDQLAKILSGDEHLNYLQENWDGEGAQPIAHATFLNANRFLGMARELELDSVLEITPVPDGDIEFEWYIDPSHVFSVCVGPSSGMVAFAGVFGESSQFYGKERVVDSIPEHLVAFIRRIVEKARTSAS